jgi:hypothetical protein
MSLEAYPLPLGPADDEVLTSSNPAYAEGDAVILYPQDLPFAVPRPRNLPERNIVTEAEEARRLEELIGPSPKSVAEIVKAAETLRVEELNGNIKSAEALKKMVTQLRYDFYHKSTGDLSDEYYQLQSWELRLWPHAPPRLLMYIQYEIQAIRDLDNAGKLNNKAVLRDRLSALRREVQLRMRKAEYELHAIELRELPGTNSYLEGWIHELDGVESDSRSSYDHLFTHPISNR